MTEVREIAVEWHGFSTALQRKFLSDDDQPAKGGREPTDEPHPVLRINGTGYGLGDTLDAFGLRHPLDAHLLRIIVALCRRRVGHADGWTSAAELSVLADPTIPADALQRFLAERLKPYRTRDLNDDEVSSPEHLIQYKPREGTSPREGGTYTGHRFGRTRGPYRIAPPPPQIRLPPSEYLTLVAHPDLLKVRPDDLGRFKEAGESAFARGDLVDGRGHLLRAIYAHHLKPPGRLSTAENERAELLVGLAEFDIELGLSAFAIGAARTAETLATRHPLTVVRACRTLSLSYGQAGMRRHAVAAAERIRHSIDKAGNWVRRGAGRSRYIATAAQAYAKNRAYKLAIAGLRRALKNPEDRGWKAILSARLAEAIVRSDDRTTIDLALRDAIEERQQAPVPWQVLVGRIVADVHMRLVSPIEAARAARDVVDLAVSARMKHEVARLRGILLAAEGPPVTKHVDDLRRPSRLGRQEDS